MNELKRITVSLDAELVDVLEHYSNCLHQTKSNTLNQLLLEAVPTLKALADMHTKMQKMNEVELKEFRKKLADFGDNTEQMTTEIQSNLEGF